MNTYTLFQSIVKSVLEGVLADVTSGTGVTTSMAVWTVTGIITAGLPVDKVVPMVHVTDGMEPAHRVLTGIGATNVIVNAVTGV